MERRKFLESISRVPPGDAVGRVRSVVGLTVSADVPLSRLGGLVRIRRGLGEPLLAEIVGFQDARATLLPIGDVRGVGPDDEIEVLTEPLSMACSDALLGRVVDGLGQACDDGPPIAGELRPLIAAGPSALRRPQSRSALPLGIRAIDGLCTLSEGQRVGLFSGAGLGKTTLLQQIARHTAANVVVLCLLGERGREVAEFVGSLPEETRRRSVVVIATSDAPALLRLHCAQTAVTAAEHFADRGKRVLLLMDSLTRFARAARDAGLSAGELPVRRGYPASVFALLPRLLERVGMRASGGSITGLYSVLVEGDDMEDPIADELRGLLDGHVLLRRELANRGHYPAIDVLHSLSRLMPSVAAAEHLRAATALRELLAVYERSRDLVELGAIIPGKNPHLDNALSRIDAVHRFLRQPSAEHTAFADTVAQLQGLLA